MIGCCPVNAKKMNTTRVLVVDDEESVRDLLRDALVEAGWAVDTAGTGAEALQLIKDNLYDAAVLDFALPDTNGPWAGCAVRVDRTAGLRPQ